MATDFIQINKTNSAAVYALELLAYVDMMRTLMDRGDKILEVMRHNNTGTVFTQIETLYGLPAGKGQTVFDLVNGADGAMRGLFQNANCKSITEIVGG